MVTVLDIDTAGTLHFIRQGNTTSFRFERDTSKHPDATDLVMLLSTVVSDLIGQNQELLASRFRNAKLSLRLDCDEDSSDFNL